MASQPFVLVTDLSELGGTQGVRLAFPIQEIVSAAPPEPAQVARPRVTNVASGHTSSTVAMPYRALPARRRITRANLAGLLVGPCIAVGLMAALCLDMPLNPIGRQADGAAPAGLHPESGALGLYTLASSSTARASSAGITSTQHAPEQRHGVTGRRSTREFEPASGEPTH